MTNFPRILVVEDSHTQAEQFRLLLESAGYRATTVADAEQAELTLASSPFDAVLTDVTLPGKDGFELCRRLKADPQLKHLPVIVLSASDDPADVEHSRAAGADGYASKLGDFEEVLQQLQESLD